MGRQNKFKRPDKEIIKEEKQEEKKENKEVELTATKNTFLADGTFVGKGDKIKVSKEYAERIKKEKFNNFK